MNQYKPVILIDLCAHGGDDKFYIRHGYVDAIIRAGGYPVGLPLLGDRDYAKRMIEVADGVMLPGSLTDVDPKLYGAELLDHCGELGPKRDESDFFLLELAAERKMPVFGICYGHQVLNVFYGGSLYQDLHHEIHSNIQHRQQDPNAPPSHSVHFEEDSRIYKMFDHQKVIEVNSFHHQGVKKVAPTLRATSYSPDGLVESYENRNGGQYVLGVQWHPERMWREFPQQLNLFTDFMESARQWHLKNR